MEKTITKECPVCERVIAVSFDEVDEAEATERIEVYFANHVLNCGRVS